MFVFMMLVSILLVKLVRVMLLNNNSVCIHDAGYYTAGQVG